MPLCDFTPDRLRWELAQTCSGRRTQQLRLMSLAEAGSHVEPAMWVSVMGVRGSSR